MIRRKQLTKVLLCCGMLVFFQSNVCAQTQKGLDIDGEAAEDWSGISVSMPDSNTVAIGANGNGDNGSQSGHVRIYAWNGRIIKKADTNNDSYSLAVKGLSSGVYLLTCGNNAVRRTYKLIKE